MDFYGFNIHGGLSKKGYELLGPSFGDSNRSYIKSLMTRREGTDYSNEQTPTNMIGDVVANAGSKYSPGVSPVETISMFGFNLFLKPTA